MRDGKAIVGIPGFCIVLLAACASGRQVQLEMQRTEVIVPPKIESIVLEPSGPIETARGEQTIRVVLRGDDRLKASFDVDGRAQNQPMTEDIGQPGVYVGSFVVEPGATGSFGVTGHLLHEPTGAHQEYQYPGRLQLVYNPPVPAVQAPPPPPTPTICTADAAEQLDQALRELVFFFDFDRADLRADEKARLGARSSVLLSQPLCRIRVLGHADDRGTTEYNRGLSERRAFAAAEYLTSLGIPAQRLEIRPYGKDHPLDSGQSEEARARNRRVELRATDPYESR